MTILEKSSTTSTSITSTTYEAINALTYTSAEVTDGNYLAVVTVDIDAPNGDVSDVLNIAISQGGSITTHTEREMENEGSHDVGARRTMCIITRINKTSGQALEVHWKRDAGTWNALGRSFCLFPAPAADFSEANQAGDSTLDNGTYTALPSSTFTTPSSGDYLMNFTCSAFGPTDTVPQFAVFVGGTIVQHTQRSLGVNSSFQNVEEAGFLISAIVSPNGSQDVEIRWRREGASGTITCEERTSVLLELGTNQSAIEASGTADDTDSSTSDQVMDDLTIVNPAADQYLAMFGSYWNVASATTDMLVSNSIFVETTEEADTDRIPLSDGSNDGADVPIATSGIINPNGSEDVSVHWQADQTDTRVLAERTLVILTEGVPVVFPILVEASQIINVTSNATTTGSVTLDLGTISENDIIIPIIAIDGDAANPTATPATYASITSTSQGAVELYYLWKRQGGTPDTTITINWTGSEQCRIMLIRVSGVVQTGDPWDVISGAVSNSASTTNVIDRLTSTEVDTLAIHAVAVDRDRVDGGDDPVGTGWIEIFPSGSSGGANGAGLIVGKNEMPLVAQVEACTFGTWSSDQNTSRGFNLKKSGAAPPVARTTFQSLYPNTGTMI